MVFKLSLEETYVIFLCILIELNPVYNEKYFISANANFVL